MLTLKNLNASGTYYDMAGEQGMTSGGTGGLSKTDQGAVSVEIQEQALISRAQKCLFALEAAGQRIVPPAADEAADWVPGTVSLCLQSGHPSNVPPWIPRRQYEAYRNAFDDLKRFRTGPAWA